MPQPYVSLEEDQVCEVLVNVQLYLILVLIIHTQLTGNSEVRRENHLSTRQHSCCNKWKIKGNTHNLNNNAKNHLSASQIPAARQEHHDHALLGIIFCCTFSEYTHNWLHNSTDSSAMGSQSVSHQSISQSVSHQSISQSGSHQ
jgi:hypothetical protein